MTIIIRVVIYIRVSTKLQENKFSLKAQTEELTRYAQAQGWEIVAQFKDVDSGGKLDKVGLNALMDFVEEGHADIVLCIDQNRLSRLDTVAWEFLKSTLRDNNVKIAEPGNITDLANEDDEFISDIKNLIAKREKRAIVRAMMRGKRQRTREGKGWGKPPMEYNYDKNTSTYSLNEQWSWIIPFIDELYLDKGYSDHLIAKELNKICTTPNGKRWADSHVRNKLKNEAYCGRMIKSFSNGETIVVEDIYPKLRTNEQQQQILEKRKNKFRRKPASMPQLLRQVYMECAYCGRKLGLHMSGVKKYGLHFYIVHNQPERHSDGSKCFFNINTLRVEKNILEAVKAIIQGEEFAKKYIQLDFDKDDLQQLENELKKLTKLRTDVRAKIDRLLPLYLDGSWTKEQLDQQKALLENELKIHEERHKKLANKRDLVKSNLFNYDMVQQYLTVTERFDVLLDGEEQMKMIGTLFPKATVYEDHIMMLGTLPNNVPIEVRVPVDPNPNGNIARKRVERNPQGKFEDVQKFLNEREKATLEDAAKHFGWAISTVYRLQDKFGEFERAHKNIVWNPEEKYTAIKAYLEEHPNALLKEIGKATGISTTSVSRIKRKYGL